MSRRRPFVGLLPLLLVAAPSTLAIRAGAGGGNPFITDKWTADPAPLVDGDTLYLFTSHDEAKDGELFHMDDWALFSTKDLAIWQDHPAPLAIAGLDWAKDPSAWASQCVKSPHDGKYYFYFCCISKQDGMCVGVAVADRPTDTFKDALGHPLIRDRDTPTPYWGNDIDPSVFIDDDGTPWLVWGNPVCYLAKLKRNMIEIDGRLRVIPLPNYTEGPWLDKRGKTYYIIYPSRAHQGFGEHLDYASAPSIEGPWTYRGRLTGGAWGSYTIHPGLCRYKGRDIIFYHNASLAINGVGGATGRRCVCAEWLEISPHGPIKPFAQTKEGLTMPPPAAGGYTATFAPVATPGARTKGFAFAEQCVAPRPQPTEKGRAKGKDIDTFVRWSEGAAYASVARPFMEAPDCDGFNMHGPHKDVMRESFTLDTPLKLAKIEFYLTDGEGTGVEHPLTIALKEAGSGKDLFAVDVDYVPQGFGIAALSLAKSVAPTLKPGVDYTLELRGAKGSPVAYWRRSRDGDKHHAFALYGMKK